MQRLLSLKLASNLPKTLSTSTTTTTTQNSSLFHFQPHKTFSLTKPPETQTQNFFFSSFPTHPLHYQHKVHGFLSNPPLRNHISLDIAITLLRLSSKKLPACRVAFLQRKAPKQVNFQFIPSSNSQECERRRSWFHRVSNNDMVWGLILANIVVFCLWKIADTEFMLLNFTTSVFHLTHRLVYTLITSEFSHFEVGHIFWNMLGLYLFGNNIGRVFGAGFLLKLYLAGAIGGSVFYLVHTAYLYLLKNRGIKKDRHVSVRLGASGAVTAIILLDIFLHPTATFMLLGMFVLGQDFLRVNKGGSAYISGATTGSAHLGGAAVAVIAWARLRKGLRV